MSVGAVLTLAAAVSSPALAGGNESQNAFPLAYDRAAGAERCPAEKLVRDTFRDQLAGNSPQSGWKVRVGVAPTHGPNKDILGRIELLDGDGARQWSNEIQARPEECATLVAGLALSLRVFLSGSDRPPPSEQNRDRHPPSGDGARSPHGSQEPILIQGKALPSKPAWSDDDSRAPVKAPPPPPSRSSPRSTPGELDRSADHRAWASLAVLTGAAPRPAARISVGYSLRWRWVSFGVEMRGVPPVSGWIYGSNIQVAHWESAIVPCVSEGIFFLCGLLSAGAKWVQVTGPASEDRSALRAGGGGRAGAELAITSRLSLFGHIDVEGTFWPSVVKLTDRISYQEAAGQVALGLGVAGTFPGR